MAAFDIVGNLPIEIIPTIVKYVPRFTDLLHFQLVSNTWRNIFSSPVTYADLVGPATTGGGDNTDADDTYSRFIKKCYDQHSIMTLNLSTKRVCHIDAAITNQVSCSAYSKDYLVLYLQHDRRFLVWDFTPGAGDSMEPKVLEFGTGRVTDMIISDKGGYLLWQETDKAAMFLFELASAFWRPNQKLEGSLPGRGIQLFPFPSGCRLSGLNPFNCDGEHLVARFGVDVGSPKKFVLVWDVRTRKLVSKFPFTQTGLWDISSVFSEKKIYLFSLPPRTEDLRLFPFPGYCKAYDLSGKVISSVGVLPGTEFRYNRMFEPSCSEGKIHYSITRQGGSNKGHCVSTMIVDENTGLGHERKFFPACSAQGPDQTALSAESYFPVQECIAQKDSQCMYFFHAISAPAGVRGEIEIWDTTSDKSRRYQLPKVRAVFANETFFCKCIGRSIYIHRYARWNEHNNEC
ncbi:hypothetical protein V1512DRAFT_256648 [Lipomyces arxii]|uniref:uncharacterized protein n=1 Tax=Lipomyces arxii TaxID=56418 RepID=UPI0034CE64EF